MYIYVFAFVMMMNSIVLGGIAHIMNKNGCLVGSLSLVLTPLAGVLLLLFLPENKRGK